MWAPVRLAWRHLLPAIASPILIDTSLRAGNLILVESALSFLGFGVKPPSASLGSLVASSTEHLTTAPWLCLFPGLVLVLVTLARSIYWQMV